MTDYSDLKSWIDRNQPRFCDEKYAVEDIVNLAIACGFSRESVATWQMEQQR